MKEGLIIGYDPGTTAGLCVLDGKGKILMLRSGRELNAKNITETVTNLGKPLIVASDVSPMPKTVEKLASSLGSKAHHPEESLSNVDKLKLVDNFIERISNDHERDALAAALNAYNEYSLILNKVEKALSTLGLSELFTEVVENIIHGKSRNVTEAVNSTLRELRRKKEVNLPQEAVEARTKADYERIVADLERKIKQLENDIDILKTFNRSLKEKLGKTQEKVSYYRKKSEDVVDLNFLAKTKDTVESLRSELDYIKKTLEQLQAFRGLELRGLLPVIELDAVRLDILKDLHERLNIEDRIIYVKDTENIQLLNDYRIKAAIVDKLPEAIQQLNFPVMSKEDISIQKAKDTSAIKQSEFEDIFKDARKKGFVEWLKGYRERKY